MKLKKRLSFQWFLTLVWAAMAAANDKRGAQAFQHYYQKLFGPDWPALEAALLKPPRHVAWSNQAEATPADWTSGPLPQTWLMSEPRDAAGFYLLDLASVMVAEQLELKSHHRVLDMCAAPGGKALILSSKLKTEEGAYLIANDLSSARRNRLKQVFQDFKVDSQLFEISGRDASRWGIHQKNSFERILLDAPCSSERHVLQNSKELKLWSQARSPQLARRQFALLASAYDTLKPGGILVYSTCALSPLENDAVLSRLIKKRSGVEILPPLARLAPLGHKSEAGLGWTVRPDLDQGWGPIYFARISKSENASDS